MPMPWVRLDTSMPDHPKILDLVDEYGDAGMAAAFVWVCSLAYSGKHGTDGFIARSVLSRLNGRAKHAKLLVDCRLWDDLPPKGWLIHGWEEYQMLNATYEAKAEENRVSASRAGRARMDSLTPEERSELGRKAARARWGDG